MIIGVIRLLAVTITVILVVAAAAAQTVYRWQRGQAAGQQRRRRLAPPARVQRHVAYYRHVLTLDQLVGRCAAVTGSRQPSTLGERFKKLASVMLGILVQFHSNANTTLQIQHIYA